jgi:glutamyl-tRNA synthetase
MTAPRVRFAPSPTGYLHVGGARTALFNWLFARGRGGVFVLRIEDTDAERSSWDMVEGIVEGLRWLGLDWDEGPDVGGPHAPYFQSQRFDRHRAMARRLLESGHAYRCYCSPEELRARREQAEASGQPYQYPRTCRDLAPERVAQLEAEGAASAIRFRMPTGRTRFDDLVHGPIEFDNEHIEDFVVLRSDGLPTYHLSVVADDIDMAITHVVRGDDHISNTPKQVLLYEAFGVAAPAFAHVPLILGPDKRRLSKRHGATSVMEYRREGHLPEAMVNFLALLGWSPGTDQELFTIGELVAAFALEGISRGNAVFNPEKLEWFNAQHLARLDAEELARRIEPVLAEAGLWHEDYAGSRRPWLLRVIELVRPRVRRIPDFAVQGRPFFAAEIDYDPAAVRKHLSLAGLGAHVAALTAGLAGVEPFVAPAIEAALRDVANRRGIKAAVLIHAARVAATGSAVSASLFDVLELLGRHRVIERLAGLQRYLAGVSG